MVRRRFVAAGACTTSRDQFDCLSSYQHRSWPNISRSSVTIAANNLPPTTSTCGGNPVYSPKLLAIYRTCWCRLARVQRTSLCVRRPVLRRRFQLPQIHQGDLIVEREVGRNTVVSASYLFSFGNSLPTFVDTNLAPPARTDAGIVGGPLAVSSTSRDFCGRAANTTYAQLTEIPQQYHLEVSRAGASANRRRTNGLHSR